jgi:hypothetical protein
MRSISLWYLRLTLHSLFFHHLLLLHYLFMNDKFLNSLMPSILLVQCHVTCNVVYTFDIVFKKFNFVVETLPEGGIFSEYSSFIFVQITDVIITVLLLTDLVNSGVIIVNINDSALSKRLHPILFPHYFTICVSLSLFLLEHTDGCLYLVFGLWKQHF